MYSSSGSNRPGRVERFIGALIIRQAAALMMVVGITLVAAFFASRVDFSNDVEVWFLSDDPALTSYRRFGEIFGDNEIAVIGLFANDIFTPRHLNGHCQVNRLWFTITP